MTKGLPLVGEALLPALRITSDDDTLTMMETGERLLQETYSYDARVVRLPRSWSCFGHLVLDFILSPLQSWTRGKDAHSVNFITPSGGGYLWLTNSDLFCQQRHNFIATHQKDDHTLAICRGMQFDVLPMGRIFKVYKYVPGSIRYGGFDKYALK